MNATRRVFSYAAFRDGWRTLAAQHGLDAQTGQPVGSTDADWWRNAALWREIGPNHSSTEAHALASLAAQTRATDGVCEVQPLRPSLLVEIAALAADGEAALKSLRELHARRGVTVTELAGMRVEVPIRRPA